MMYRYLLNISYIGTNFRGLQKNSNHPIPGLKSSIQESIEWAIKEFAPKNEPKLILSSRTDVGVHALNTAVHIDLESNFGGPYRESFVTTRLNKFFYRENLAIRIQKTEIVPETFHARFSVKRRIYEYRLAIPKKELPAGSKERFVPIDELYRCHFEKIPKFDVHLAKKAAELIQGTHDFRSFMGTNPETIKKDAFFALRHIDSISIEPGETTCHELIKPLAVETYNYFNVRVIGHSFLNKQVRRIVAVILAAAQNRLTIRNVYELLTIPSKHSWPSGVGVLPPHGLYLLKVEYDDKDKEFPVNEPVNCDSDLVKE